MPVHKVRTFDDWFDPGGGGVNVARMAVELGEDVMALALTGGTTGALLEELLKRDHVPHHFVPTAAHTRMSHMIYERESGLEYRFVPVGETPTEDEVAALLERVGEVECRYFVASGSVPPGVPPDTLANVARIVTERGARFVLDSSGVGLTATLGQAPVHLVKPSLNELKTVAGRALDSRVEQEEAAAELVKSGAAEIVAVTLGGDGAILATRDQVLYRPAPKMKVWSAVGAGDSFLAAMVVMLARGESAETAFNAGLAAGTAAVLTPGTRMFRSADFERIRAELARSW